MGGRVTSETSKHLRSTPYTIQYGLKLKNIVAVSDNCNNMFQCYESALWKFAIKKQLYFTSYLDEIPNHTRRLRSTRKARDVPERGL